MLLSNEITQLTLLTPTSTALKILVMIMIVSMRMMPMMVIVSSTHLFMQFPLSVGPKPPTDLIVCHEFILDELPAAMRVDVVHHVVSLHFHCVAQVVEAVDIKRKESTMSLPVKIQNDF